MNSKTILTRAKTLVGEVEDDTLARAALAIQNSEFGVGRQVDARIAEIEGRAPPRVSSMDINGLRAIVMRVTGRSMELDDPFLLLLAATQDAGMERLKESINRNKIKYDEMYGKFWLYRGLFYCSLCLSFFVMFTALYRR